MMNILSYRTPTLYKRRVPNRTDLESLEHATSRCLLQPLEGPWHSPKRLWRLHMPLHSSPLAGDSPWCTHYADHSGRSRCWAAEQERYHDQQKHLGAGRVESKLDSDPGQLGYPSHVLLTLAASTQSLQDLKAEARLPFALATQLLEPLPTSVQHVAISLLKWITTHGQNQRHGQNRMSAHGSQRLSLGLLGLWL